jgi:hypothetical protein
MIMLLQDIRKMHQVLGVNFDSEVTETTPIRGVYHMYEEFSALHSLPLDTYVGLWHWQHNYKHVEVATVREFLES